MVLGSLVLGMAGYAYFEGLRWRDAFLHAGLVFLVATGIVLAPVVHRLPHRPHWDAED